MDVTFITEAARYHHNNSGLGDILVFRFLWKEFHWWSILLYAAFVFTVAFAKRLLGITDGD